MTFLNPAILFGLLAASIPIVLHFLNLRKLKKVEFSTLQFLKELQKTKIRRIKLKQWLLLLLRFLIIIFIVMAFARPTLKSVSLGSSSAKTSAVIIIDNTFSMSVVTDKGSYLNRAKQIAIHLLDNLKTGDEVVIIPLAAENDELIQPTSNLSEAKKYIKNTELSEVSNTINKAIISAAKYLYQPKNYNKEIYVLTDFQKSRLVDSPNELSNIGKAIPSNTGLYFFELGENEVANLGIESIKPANQIYEVGKLIGFSVRVKNYSNSPHNNNVISFFINGKRSAQHNISLSSKESKEIYFETTLLDTGLVNISAELEDDEILLDNKVFACIYVPSKISLLISSDKSLDANFLKLALGIPNDKIRVSEVSSSQLNSINLKSFDALFIVGTNGITGFNEISNYLNVGGCVSLFPGSQNSSESYDKFLGNMGIKSSTVLLGKPNEKESITEFKQINFQHPLLDNIFEDVSKTKLESPEIFCYLKSKIEEKRLDLVSLLDNSPFLSEILVGKGKLISFFSAPALSWNTFPLKAFFSPLINNVLFYSSSKIKNDSSFVCGNQIDVDISGAPTEQIKIIKPNKADEYINTDSLNNKKYLFYKNTEFAGTYQFYSGKKRVDYFSVNHDPRESVTDRFSQKEFEDYLKQIGYEGKIFSLDPNSDFTKQIYESRFGTELWKYLLILVLILAVAESFLSKSSKKDITE